MRAYSLRRRLVLVILGAMTLVLAALAAFLYIGVRDAAWRQHDDGLLARARALSALAEHDDEGYELEAPALPHAYLELWLPNGSQLGSSPTLQVDRTATGFVDLRLPDGRAGRAIVMRFVPRDEVGDAGEVTLVLAEGIEDVQTALASIRNLFVVVGALALALVTWVVWWITGRGLAPLSRLAAQIDRIDDRHLATRLPIDGQPTELVTPVTKLNELLGRLDSSFARERQFTADVSHELRTPLAGLRTLLEVTALAERTAPEYQQALADALAVVLQLGAVVENLLTLARLDAGQLATEVTEVELRDLVEDCWKPHAALAAARGLTFENRLAAGCARVDREKLRVILGNLLANAAEYTESGGWIRVDADGDVLVAVSDSGPALPDEQKIFDRLWRGDASRTATGIHCGIGLALARSLADHAGLSLTAGNRSDGTVRFAIAAR